MHIASGDILKVRLGEAIVASNAHVTAQAVTSGQQVLRYGGLVTAASTALLSGDSAFVDEVTIYNADTATHTVIPSMDVGGTVYDYGTFTVPAGQSLHYKPAIGWSIPCQPPSLNSGAVFAWNIASGSVNNNALSSGAVMSGHIGSGQVGTSHIVAGITSSSIASGQIGSPHIGNAAVLSAHVASGQIGSPHIASGGVLSANIASGQIGLSHLASGLNDLVTLTAMTTEEAISGYRCVNVSQSGRLRVAMAGVSGRMPVAGISIGNYTSGTVLSPFSGNAPIVIGAVLPTSGMLPNPATFGGSLFCGMSGNVVLAASVTSGVLGQRVGYMLGSGFMYVNIAMNVTSGLEATFAGTF